MAKRETLEGLNYLLREIRKETFDYGIPTITAVFAYLSNNDAEIKDKATEVFCAWYISAQCSDIYDFRLSPERWKVIEELSVENRKKIYKAFFACKFHDMDFQTTAHNLYERALQKFRGDDLVEVVGYYVPHHMWYLLDKSVKKILEMESKEDANLILIKFANRILVGEDVIEAIFTTSGIESEKILERLNENQFIPTSVWEVILSTMSEAVIKDFYRRYRYVIPEEIKVKLPK